MGLAWFIIGVAMRSNIPFGLPHLVPTIAAAIVAAPVDGLVRRLVGLVPGFGAAMVAEMFGADGNVLAAKERSLELDTEDCLSYCSSFNMSEREAARIESVVGPTPSRTQRSRRCARSLRGRCSFFLAD